jgi:hypothetical protein
LAQGLLVWQSDGDMLDPRLQFLAASDQAVPEVSQPGTDWQRLWGWAGVKRPFLNWPLERILADDKTWRLDSLVLRGPRGSLPGFVDRRAGADLEALGILKKGPRK